MESPLLSQTAPRPRAPCSSPPTGAAARHGLSSSAQPVRFLGVTMVPSEPEMEPLRSIDPLLFQGSDPSTGYFMWFSVLSTPEANGSDKTTTQPYYEAQINVSWLVNRGPEDEVPISNAGKLARMKAMAVEVLRRAIENIPDDTEVREIRLADWSTLEWEDKGMVTMLGDAAHAMTTCAFSILEHYVEI
jgi:hypothetical protein